MISSINAVSSSLSSIKVIVVAVVVFFIISITTCHGENIKIMVNSANPPPSPPPWKQDRFAISFWVDPMVPPDRFDVEYKRIAEANFTVLLGGFGANNPTTVTQQIAAATKNDLKAVPNICDGACVNISGAWGFQIADEPDVSKFNSVAKLVADAKAVGQMAFVNLLPNYAEPKQLGADTYKDYLATFMEKVKPNMLSVDHYPDFDESTSKGNNKTKKGYILNLLALRETSLSVKPNIPFWNFFNAMPYNQVSQYDISEGELRWQAYTSLAIGSKGVLYFCYWTPPGAGFSRGQAIMTPTPGNIPNIADQSPGYKYPMVQRINSKLRVFGNWLLEKVSSSVVQVSGSGTTFLKHLRWTSINGSATGPNSEFMLGCYDNNNTIVLVNQDSNHPALATVGIDDENNNGRTAMMELDAKSGILVPPRDDSPFLSGFQIALLPGDARLFTWV